MIRVIAVMDSTGPGGAETSMAAMAPFMREHGIELEVAYFVDRVGVKDQLLGAGIRLWHVPPGKTRLHTMWHLRRLIKERRPDVVHTMVYEADIIGRPAAYLAKVPVISSIINEMYGPAQLSASPSVLKLRMGQMADILTARLVTRFHAITNTVADKMAPRLRIRRSDISVIYRGRDLVALGSHSSERRRAVRSSLGISDDSNLILAVGRHEPQKALDVLINAMPSVVSAIPAARLVVAGRQGSATPILESYIAALQLGDRVTLLGHRSDVADLLAAADVLAFPSAWEGLGGVVIEAMAIGIPIVCNDLPVLREVVDRGNAGNRTRFISFRDDNEIVPALVESMMGLRTFEPDREALDAFDVRKVAALHADLYRQVVA